VMRDTHVSWSASARRKARPGRLIDRPRAKLPRPKLDRLAVELQRRTESGRWDAGDLAVQEAHRVLAAQAQEGLDPNASVDVEAVRTNLFSDLDLLPDSDAVSDLLVPWWVATRGAPFAVSALLRANELRKSLYVRVRLDQAWYLPRIEHWGALRRALACVEESDFQAARTVAETARAQASLALRCALDYAFPGESAWATSDAEQCLGLFEFPFAGASLLASQVPAGMLLRLAGACSARRRPLDEQILYTMIDVRGADAAHPLGALLARTPTSELVDALSIIESVDAAVALLRYALGSGDLRKRAKKYLLAHPDLTLSAFAQMYAEGGAKPGSAEQMIFEQIVGDRPELLAQIAAGLPEVAARSLERLLSAASTDASSPDFTRIRQTWKRIEAWLSRKHPSGSDLLAPGATPQQVEKLATDFGGTLPEGLCAMLRIHNGNDPAFEFARIVHSGPYDCGGGTFKLLSIKEMIDKWRVLNEAIDLSSDENALEAPPVGVKALYWQPTGWLPIALGDDTDCFVVDLDPAEGGTVGQVFAWYPAEGPGCVVAASVEAWLGRLADCMESGHMVAGS